MKISGSSDLRHTFATRLVQNGVDLYVDLYKVKELLGHKSLAMTMRYSHHYPESLRSSVEVLDVCYNSATFKDSGVAEIPKNPLESTRLEWRSWQTRWT